MILVTFEMFKSIHSLKNIFYICPYVDLEKLKWYDFKDKFLRNAQVVKLI